MSTATNPKHKCLLVTHDAVNFSPSKAKYSFSRDQRFRSISGVSGTPSEFTHHLPQTFGRRSPSFGIGDRFKVKIKTGKFFYRLFLHFCLAHTAWFGLISDPWLACSSSIFLMATFLWSPRPATSQSRELGWGDTACWLGPFYIMPRPVPCAISS